MSDYTADVRGIIWALHIEYLSTENNIREFEKDVKLAYSNGYKVNDVDTAIEFESLKSQSSAFKQMRNMLLVEHDLEVEEVINWAESDGDEEEFEKEVIRRRNDNINITEDFEVEYSIPN